MRTTDMTRGRPIRLLLGFALPMMAGNVFQQLYTLVDAAFVGQFAGISALAAVGTADWFCWGIFGIVWGCTQGFSIRISQRFGAEDGQGLRAAIAQAVLLTACIAGALTLAGQVVISPVLRLLHTPDDIAPLAEAYLRILFGGLPILASYNVQSSILRAMGDAKTPLGAMTLASLVNIALDALFVIRFRWGVAGAAAATLIAQTASSVYCFRALRKIPEALPCREDWRLQRKEDAALLRLAAPVALQNTIISVGGLAVQRVMNGYGSLFIAGMTATNKLYGLLEMAAISYGGAIASYTGQNCGAKNSRRIREGVRTGAFLAMGTALVISIVLWFAGRTVLSLFVDGTSASREQVLDIAQAYLRVMLLGLFTLYLLYVYRSALQGMGDTVIPMFSGLVELFMRVGSVLLLPRFLGETGVFLAEPAAWAGAAALLMAGYFRRLHALAWKEE